MRTLIFLAGFLATVAVAGGVSLLVWMLAGVPIVDGYIYASDQQILTAFVIAAVPAAAVQWATAAVADILAPKAW